jgi:exopolyphosphatase/guanosine-5'-triphosphate,3'-diphosphate pyrophosphatase
VLDVGGGSTELILGEFRVSLDVGSVRLTERYLKSDPPTQDELDTAASFVDSLLPELGVTAAVGVAGSVAQLSALVGELTVEAVEAELELLASLPLAERLLLPNLDPGRAPVIVAGALIIACILRRYRLSRLLYSVRDLLDGVALEAVAARE